MKNKIITLQEAVKLIKDHDFLAIQGTGGGVGEPTAILKALGAYYQEHHSPRNLTLCHASGLGDGKEIGTQYLAHKGLIKRNIAGHVGMTPGICQLINDNEIEAYNFPQGILSQMYREVASKKPGVITKVGLGTFVDPRIEGGKMNDKTQKDLVKVITLNHEEWLFFPRFNINCSLVRGTTADTRGNITFEEEGALLEAVSIAQAAKNCGGIVIAQVKYLTEYGTLKPKDIKIPGIYVDYIVIDLDQRQTCLDFYDPALAGQTKVPFERIEKIPSGPKRIIALRALQEIKMDSIVNIGVGVPSGIASVAVEKGRISDFTFTIEQGAIGGMPAGGVIFGVVYNPDVIIQEDAQFDFYDGGGLDVAFLGMGEVDEKGNINVSKLKNRYVGCGGFINISQNAKKVIFCGIFTAKGLKCEVNNKLNILSEGMIKKFVKNVMQITFSGEYAQKIGQEVLFITERAVFKLTDRGLKLIEIAPGIDLEKDILQSMEFTPIVDNDLKMMNKDCFK